MLSVSFALPSLGPLFQCEAACGTWPTGSPPRLAEAFGHYQHPNNEFRVYASLNLFATAKAALPLQMCYSEMGASCPVYTHIHMHSGCVYTCTLSVHTQVCTHSAGIVLTHPPPYTPLLWAQGTPCETPPDAAGLPRCFGCCHSTASPCMCLCTRAFIPEAGPPAGACPAWHMAPGPSQSTVRKEAGRTFQAFT